jgi:hypothetical protein
MGMVEYVYLKPKLYDHLGSTDSQIYVYICRTRSIEVVVVVVVCPLARCGMCFSMRQ